MRKLLLAVALIVLCPILMAQQTLDNSSVTKLVKAGLSEDLIVSTINSAPGTYDTSAEGLIALKTAGVSDKEVAAIVAKISSVVPAAPIATQSATAPPIQAPAPPFHSTDGKIRIYVTDHPMFEANSIAMASAPCPALRSSSA